LITRGAKELPLLLIWPGGGEEKELDIGKRFNVFSPEFLLAADGHFCLPWPPR